MARGFSDGEDYDDGRFGGRGSSFKKKDDEPVTFEGRVEHQTAKAYLVEPTLIKLAGDGTCWVPKSQIKSMTPSGDENVYEFTVSAWWAGKNGMT